MRAIAAEVKYNPFFIQEADVLKEVTSKDLVAAALASGECNSVRQLLRKENLDSKVKTALRRMEIVQRRVDGSDAERSSCRYKFVAMRIWNGFSTLFFTLNPNDVHSPLTVLFANHEHTHVEKISLDSTDAEMHKYIDRARKNKPPCTQRACRTRSLGTTALFPYNGQASAG